MASQKPLKELLTDPGTTADMVKDECSGPITPPHSDESSPSLSPPHSDSSLPPSPEDPYSAEVFASIKQSSALKREEHVFSNWVLCFLFSIYNCICCLYIIDLNILLGSLSYYTQSLYFIRYSPC